MLRQLQVVMGQPILPLLLQSHLPHYQLSVICLAELQCQYLPPWSLITHSVPIATAELHQLEFRTDIGVRVSPLQAVPDPVKFRLLTSVLVHVRVGTLPIVLSESRYLTLDQLPT